MTCTVHFPRPIVCRQGSVYVIKLGPSGTVGSGSVVQLDGWHEATHPSWWSSTVDVEAELHDGFRPLTPLTSPEAPRTDHQHQHGAARRVASGGHAADQNDYSVFTTFIRLRASAGTGQHGTGLGLGEARYTVAARGSRAHDASACVFDLRLRARPSAPGATAACVVVAAHLGGHPAPGQARQQTVCFPPTPTNANANANATGLGATAGAGAFVWAGLVNLVRTPRGDADSTVVVILRAVAGSGALDVDSLQLVPRT